MNGNGGKITSAKLNYLDNLIAASSSDGILTVRQLDKEFIEAKAKEVELPDPCRYRNQESELILDKFDVDIESKIVEDITDISI